MQISVVIITYNEERNIGRCLQSVQEIADEIIVVDSFSEDGTEAICKTYGVFFQKHTFSGYLEQKNYANQLASCQYILSLDADESLSPQLVQSILTLKATVPTELTAFQMNRFTNYCGQWIRYAGWYPDAKVRLFPNGKAEWSGRNPHETLTLLDGIQLKKIQGNLLHHSYYSVEEHWERAEKYATMAATSDIGQKDLPSFLRPYISAFAGFVKVYFLKKGFLEGRAGWNIARITAWEKWRKYSLQRTLINA